MDTHRLRNLTFLMSLGGLSAACFSDNGPHEGASGSGDATGGTTGTAGTTHPGTTSDIDSTTTTSGADETTGTTEPATATTGPDTTTDAATTDITTTSTTDPGPDTVVCMQYVATYVGCYPRLVQYLDSMVADCEMVIIQGHEIDGPMCSDTYAELYACLGALDCQQLAFEFEHSFHCAIQRELIDQFCPVTGKDF